ncbi:MAG: hypothetical protein KF845_05870 [Cyclobacteriaceae bacterium]|nr:hypothetical protein [Cyclobacteriaceae bacterium]
MPEATIKYKNWKLIVDREATIATYQKMTSQPEGCTCTPCENYLDNREQVYPNEVKKLFNRLGIDYRKESEVFESGRSGNGQYWYGGYFFFIGRFYRVRKRDKKHRTKMSKLVREMAVVTRTFSIDFSKKPDSPMVTELFEDTTGFIEVGVSFQIPWTIGEEKEAKIMDGWTPIKLWSTKNGLEIKDDWDEPAIENNIEISPQIKKFVTEVRARQEKENFTKNT